MHGKRRWIPTGREGGHGKRRRRVRAPHALPHGAEGPQPSVRRQRAAALACALDAAVDARQQRRHVGGHQPAAVGHVAAAHAAYVVPLHHLQHALGRYTTEQRHDTRESVHTCSHLCSHLQHALGRRGERLQSGDLAVPFDQREGKPARL